MENLLAAPTLSECNPAISTNRHLKTRWRSIRTIIWLICRNGGPKPLSSVTNVAESVRLDLEKLTKQAAENSADYLRVLSSGYLLLKQEDKSREAIKKLIALKPKLSALESALDDYANQIYANGIKGAGPDEVRKLAWAVAAEHPKSGYARSQSAEMARREEAPLASIELICRSWIEERPDHPKPHLNLALAYERRRQKYDEAAASIEKAITLLLQRKAVAYGDSSGLETEVYDLPQAYALSAKIAFQRQQYPHWR